MPRDVRERGSPSVVEVKRQLETPIKVSGTAPQPTTLPFSTPFSTEIINTLHYGKVKTLTFDLYDGMTIPEEPLGVYKA